MPGCIAASLLAMDPEAISETGRHLRFVVVHLDSLLDDQTVSVEAFTTVLHMRDTVSAHICAAEVLNNLGAVAGARRVLAEAAQVVLALCDAVARSRRGQSENQRCGSVARVACW